MPTFDVHQHLLPPQFLDELRRRSEPPRLVGKSLELREGSFPFERRDHDVGERLALLDHDDVDVAVVSLAPTMEAEGHPELMEAYHDGIREVTAATGGRVRALAAGACLEDFAGASVSAASMLRGLGDLPDELSRAGQPLFVHPGPPGVPPDGAATWWTAVVDYPTQMQAAYFSWLDSGVARHPHLNVIFAILAGGAPFQLERLRSRGGDTTAARHPRIHLDTASYGAHALRASLRILGETRLVYGSDRPVIDASPTLSSLAALGEDVLDAVIARNPGRIFT